jgi:16S rRNA (cytidine1402-2'-O)-methyltransferase
VIVQEEIQRGTLYVVSTPIGNLEDITLRAVKVLSGVDLIAAEDTRTTKVLLNRYNIAKPMLSYFSHNERRRAPEILERLKAGASVALVSDAGTPGISDPAYVLISQALEQEIPVVPIPGASALLAALVVSGLPTDRFVFEGFLPLKKGRKTKLQELKLEERTIVLYESPHRVLKTLGELLESLGERDVVVAREMTKKFEELMRGSLSSVLADMSKRQARGEYVIVISGAKGA